MRPRQRTPLTPDTAARAGKVADALRPGGALAVISTHHVVGGSEQFFADVQRCYLTELTVAYRGLSA